MKKRILSILLICCMVFSLFPASALAANSDMPFTDVKTTDWFYKEVCYVYNESLMQGTSATTFDPNVTTSRGMIVTILYRLEGEPAFMNANIFTDVVPGSWYEKAVVWANGKGIVEGYGSGKFGPNDPITREQLAAIMYRYANYKGYDVSAKADLSGFVDGGKISSYALNAMKWANAAGLVSGVGASKLDPQGDATRAQVAAIFYRFCNDYVAKDTCKVTFDLNYENAGTYTTQNVEVGKKATQPTAPKRSGYTFAGWYTKKVGGNKFNFGTAIAADLTLYARWTKNGGDTSDVPTYIVTFDVQGHGTEPASQTVVEYGRVTEPTAPTADGWTFEGWYQEADCETAWDFDTDTIAAATTLYAKWDKTSGNVLPSGFPISGSELQDDVPDRAWIGSAAGTNCYIFESEGHKFLTFNYSDGDSVSSVSVDLALALTASGENWTYENDDLSITFIMTGGALASITVVDKRATPAVSGTYVAPVTVTFDVQGHGTAPASQSVVPNSKATEPTPAPTAAGFDFDGWYTDETFTTKWNFATDTVTAATTLYAKWTAKDTAIEEAVANGTEIKVDGKTVAVTAGDGEEATTLDAARATALAGKINDLLESSAVAGAYETNLENSTQIAETDGLNAIIAALKDEASDATAKNNLDDKTSADVDLQIKVVLSAVNVKATDDLTVTSMEFDVTPIATTTVKDSSGKTVSVTADVSDCLTENVTFRLPIDSSLKTDGNTIAVYHEGEFLGNYEIKGTAPDTYIEIESDDFSKYSYELLNANNAGAKIGTTLYFKFADAVAKVENDQTITLLKPATGNVTISREVSFTVDTNSKNFNATVSAGTNFALYKTDETQSPITYKCLLVNTQFDIFYKDAGDAAFSGTHGDSYPTTHTYGTATTLVAPTKDGYAFKGWFTNKECTGAAVTSLGAEDYAENITLYAKWAELKTLENIFTTVSKGFPTSDGQETVPDKAWKTADGEKCYLYSDSLVFAPTSGDKETYSTAGKNAEKSGDNYVCVYDDVTITFVMTNGVLTGITVTGTENCDGTYTAPESTVTFDLNGATGTAPDPQTVDYGEKATKPSDPTFANHTFGGWYKEAECTTAWNFDNAVTENMTLYAKWTTTLATILGDSFPTSSSVNDLPENAWVNENGKHCFKGSNYIVLEGGSSSPTYSLDKIAVKFGDGYKLEVPPATFIFHMMDGKLASVEFEHSTSDTYRGTYIPPVEYMDWDETNNELVKKYVGGCIEVTDEITELAAGKVYVVKGENVQTGSLTVSGTGTATLILEDDAKLTVTGEENKAGIKVASGNTLVINGQSAGTGVLDVTGGANGAGIGGGSNESCGTVIINSGTVNATGGNNGAGIGGGAAGAGGTVTINGGTVTATGKGGAGIGGGYGGESATVTINGGVVTANGGKNCAGIGGGSGKNGGNVTINGGSVTATGGEGGAGIGGGFNGTGGDVTINGGTITATAGSNARAIGGGSNKSSAHGTVNFKAGMDFLVKAGTDADSATEVAQGDYVNNHSQAYASIESAPLKYMDWDNTGKKLVEKSTTDYIKVTTDTTALDAGKVYVVKDTVTTGTLTVNGTTEQPTILVLADGATLTATGATNKAGIDVASGKALTITGQKLGSGTLIAIGNGEGAGIGGSSEDVGGSVTINGGSVTATGGSDGAAGIGGGYRGDHGDSTITINGGTITATGGESAAGIGEGYKCYEGSVTINGGEITAIGGSEGGQAIGGVAGCTVTFSAGVDYKINAGADQNNTAEKTTAEYAADHSAAYVSVKGGVKYMAWDAEAGKLVEEITSDFIEVTNSTTTLDAGKFYVVKGADVQTGTLTVTGTGTATLILMDGAKLTATGNDETYTAGINVASGKALVINGQSAGTGVLDVTGGNSGAGIGGGGLESCGTVTINGGTITATGGESAAGIGGGVCGNGGDVTINGGTVTATGGEGGAGIGNATEYYDAGGTVTINGGTVTATGGSCAAGIGGGYGGNGVTVTINGGTVTATGKDGGEAIGGGAPDGNTPDSGTVTFGTAVDFTINAGDDQDNTSSMTTTEYADDHSAKYVGIQKAPLKYMDWDNTGKKLVEKSTTDYIKVTTETTTLDVGKIYVAKDTVSTAGLVVNGTTDKPTTLVLADGATLTVTETANEKAGIDVASDKALVITGQSGGTGTLVATGGWNAAAVGGSKNGSCGNVTINGGNITATGGSNSAGIGGANGGNGGIVTINGGVITATGSWSAGIGGGNNGTHGTVTFGAGVNFALRVGDSAANAAKMTMDAYKQDHSAAYMTARVLTPVKYMAWDSAKKALVEETANDYLEVTNATTTLNADEIYVVKGADVQTGTLTVNGTADKPTTLILADGAKLTATGEANGAGISVASNNALVITGQSVGTGTLIANGGDYGAGIGGGNAGNGGTVTINGGTVNVTGGSHGAAIGGGYDGNGGTAMINGGTVNVTGGSCGAGIGGGEAKSSIGGTNGGTVTINGGSVTANSGNAQGAGIGGGRLGAGANVTINGGSVTAIATGAAEAIGSGYKDNAGSGTLTFGADLAFAVMAGDDAAGATEMKQADYASNHSAKYVSIKEAVKYMDWDGSKLVEKVTGDYIEVTDSTTTLDAGKFYVVNGEVSTAGLVVNGTTASPTWLILADGAKLTATGGNNKAGINVADGKALVITGQKQGNGTLTAKGGAYSAGIGINNDYNASSGNITINGGTVTANGGGNSAGIGGGGDSHNGTVTINGGTVTANGGAQGAGIGGGYSGNGGTVTINGGTVTATGGYQGAGIGGGFGWTRNGAGANVTINGGNVTATGQDNAAAIGTGAYNTMEGGGPKPGSLTFGTDVEFTVKAGSSSGSAADKTTAQYKDDHSAKYVSIKAIAKEEVKYMDWDDTNKQLVEKKTNDYIEVTSETTTLDGGKFYVVKGEDVQTGGLTVSGTGAATLILMDGAQLTATGKTTKAGINVASGKALVITGQSGGTGTLIANGIEGAGIGGDESSSLGNVTINGGTVNATSYTGAGIGGGLGGTGGNVTINGGTVTADGGSGGAGIGSGDSGDGVTVTINGGTVTAIGGDKNEGVGGGAAGIGGGVSTEISGTVTINGGTVNATGGECAAGIGGGFLGASSTVTINGGTVTAIGGVGGGTSGAGIGGAVFGAGGTVIINGGTVTATSSGDYAGAGIGGGYCGDGASVTINGGTVTATGYQAIGKGAEGESIGTVTFGTDVAFAVKAGTNADAATDTTTDAYAQNHSAAYVSIAVDNSIKYMDWNGTKLVEKKTNDYIEVTNTTTALEAGKFYVVKGEDVKTGSLTVNGTTESPTWLILADGAQLTASGAENQAGINVSGDKVLIITGQSGCTGKLIAKGGYRGAGIGCGNNGTGGTITINSGTVTANGGSSAAGIGIGARNTQTQINSNVVVTINGGTVTATGGENGAGIGGTYYSDGGTVTVNSGTVTANGGFQGAGIGGGYNGNGGTLTVNGGTVTANGGEKAAGIGGGAESNLTPVTGGTVTVNSGLVTANGGIWGAGIGGGYEGDGGSVTINGGKVVATGGAADGSRNSPAAIGRGGQYNYWELNAGTLTFKSGGTFSIDAGTSSASGAYGSREKAMFESSHNEQYACIATSGLVVTFNMMGHGNSIAQQTNKMYGSKISTNKVTPSDSSYNFDGWYRTEAAATTGELSEKWDYTVTGNITLYARWVAK